MVKMFSDWIDHMGIYLVNLTWFYIFSMVISFLSVIATTWACLRIDKNEQRERNEADTRESEEYSLQTQYKLARQKLAEQKLTPQQRSKEKEIEAEQLSAILKLLQEQSDTFQVSSMDQLKDQLRLYRDQ